MAQKVTKRQQAVLDCIEACIREKGYGPTVVDARLDHGFAPNRQHERWGIAHDIGWQRHGVGDVKGYGPTVREVCQTLGLSSPSTVHVHLKALEDKGYIKREEK